jgi:hypothetical protein
MVKNGKYTQKWKNLDKAKGLLGVFADKWR